MWGSAPSERLNTALQDLLAVESGPITQPDEDDVELALLKLRRSIEGAKSALRTLRAAGRLPDFALAHATHLDISLTGIEKGLKREPSHAQGS